MKIEDEIRELKRRVQALEDEKHGKSWPSLPPLQPNPIHMDGHSKCSKCGIILSGVMSYCCPNAQCPTGLGSPQC